MDIDEPLDVDLGDLEQEQIEYIKRNAANLEVPESENMYPDPLKKPLTRPVVLDKEQERKLIEEIRSQIPYTMGVAKTKKKFSLSGYFSILSTSFVDIMDDLLNFDGDMESLTSIFTKDDRLILIGTIVMLISIFLIMNRNSS